MTTDFLSLAHDNITTLKPYQPGGSIQALREKINRDDIIKLASNENPLGVSENVVKAIHQASDLLHFYPDSKNQKVKQALADKYQIDTNRITLGTGSEEIIRLLMMAFNRTNRHVLFPQFSFIAYKIIAQTLNMNWNEVPSPDYRLDLNALSHAASEQTALLFLANPNNPTGEYISENTLYRLLESIPRSTILVIDEAYYEYAKATPDYPDTLSLQKEFPNLVILRTFSKIYGLAGLRIGYSIACKPISDILKRVKLPFSVSSLSQTAALAVLKDHAFIEQSLAVNQEGREQLVSALKSMGLNPLPSITNFITVDMKEDTAALYQYMCEQGIILRTLHPYQMPNHLRISVGLKDQNERVIDQLKLFRSEKWLM